MERKKNFFFFLSLQEKKEKDEREERERERERESEGLHSLRDVGEASEVLLVRQHRPVGAAEVPFEGHRGRLGGELGVDLARVVLPAHLGDVRRRDLLLEKKLPINPVKETVALHDVGVLKTLFRITVKKLRRLKFCYQ